MTQMSKVYDNLEGILIYRKLNNIKNHFCKINYSSITLLAKKINSNHKWLGKNMIDFFRIRLNEKTKVILADDTDIPNYYTKLGFKKEDIPGALQIFNFLSFPSPRA